MQHTPDAYGEYWAGAVRIAVGVYFTVAAYHLLTPFLGGVPWPALLLGWGVLAGSVLVGSFAVALGIARIVETAAGT